VRRQSLAVMLPVRSAPPARNHDRAHRRLRRPGGFDPAPWFSPLQLSGPYQSNDQRAYTARALPGVLGFDRPDIRWLAVKVPEQIGDRLADASCEVSEISASPQGLLRVPPPTAFGRQRIAPLLPSFLARYPQIRIDAHLSDRFVDVVTEGFDLAIRVGLLRDR
jgi:LysR substrate binding domain